MRFEWDSAKARTNLAKHGIRFETAQAVFDDPLHVVLPDRIVEDEERWHAIGTVKEMTVLLVVHLYPDTADPDVVRIIGARRATTHERKRYERQGF